MTNETNATSTPLFTFGQFTVVDMGEEKFMRYYIAQGSLPIAAFWGLEDAKRCAEVLATDPEMPA